MLGKTEPREIYRITTEEGDHRILAWSHPQAIGPELHYENHLIVTSENYDPDPLSGGWMVDDFLQLDQYQAKAVRGAIDAFILSTGIELSASHLGKHGLTEGDRSLLIDTATSSTGKTWSGDVDELVDGWTLSDEHGEEIWISPSRLEWLTLLLPQILASYKAAKTTEEA